MEEPSSIIVLLKRHTVDGFADNVIVGHGSPQALHRAQLQHLQPPASAMRPTASQNGGHNYYGRPTTNNSHTHLKCTQVRPGRD